MYVLLTNDCPFVLEGQKGVLKRQVCRDIYYLNQFGKIWFSNKNLRRHSLHTRQLLRQMLAQDPGERISVNNALISSCFVLADV
jgi:hypothetical protein